MFRLLIAPLAALVVVVSAAPAPAAWLGDGKPRPPTVTVDDRDPARLRVAVTMPGVALREAVVQGRTVSLVELPGGHLPLVAGEPALPFLPLNLVIPGQGDPVVRVVDATWHEVAAPPPVPSRGNLPRTVRPTDRPLEFGAVYAGGGVHPDAVVRAGRPYVLRDVRGLGLRLFPVRWDAGRGVLLVLRTLELEIETRGGGGVNPLPALAAPPAPGFADLAGRRFANPPDRAGKYRPLATGGRLLVVAPAAFVPALQPFLQWKRERGLEPLVLTVEAAGGTADAIRDSVAARFAEPAGLTYLVLAGDSPLVPGFKGLFEQADDDTRYAQVAGDDLYPDLFVSRVSARDTLELRTQLVKFVRYERDPDPDGAWYAHGAGAASNLGDPTDAVLADRLREDLLGWTFTAIDRIYEPDAAGADIAAALDQGRSLLNYLGHGSGTSWGNPPFANADVHALANGWMNPWIVDVSCANGRFSDPECFAEAWLRTGSPTAPRGAIAMYSASTTTPWVPPTVMQAETIGLLASGQADEIGALCQHGIMKVLDVYPGDEGRQLVEQYNIFGDCSLQVRTARPQPLQVAHHGQLAVGVDVFPVNAGVAGARVAVTGPGVLHGTAVTDATGYAAVPLVVPVTAPGTVILTVTGRNLLPHREPVPVTVPVAVGLRPSPGPLVAGQEGALAVDLTDPAPGLGPVDVTLGGWGVPARTVRVEGAGTAAFAGFVPPYGEELEVRGRDAGSGQVLFRATVPVTGAATLTAPAVGAGVPAIALDGALVPGEPGTVTGTAAEAGLALHVRGCGVDTTAAAAGGAVTLVVRPDSLGTVTIALLKEGYAVHTATVPVVAALGTVGGRIIDPDGVPVPRARVRLYRSGQDRAAGPLVDTTSDGQGWWRHEPDLPVGACDLVVERFGYLTHDAPSSLLFGPNDWRTALPPAPRASLQGTVTAAGTGLPLGALVEVRRPQDRVLVASVYADAGGHFATLELPVGRYLAVVTAAGHLPRATELDLAESGAPAALALAPLTGTIVVVDANLPLGAGHTFPARLDKQGDETAVGYTATPAGSGLAILSSLHGLGYAPAYQPTALIDPAAWPGYDLVVLARGDHDAPLPPDLRAALLAHVAGGGRLLTEGGDLAAAHRADPEFLSRVLHAAAWAGDRGDTVDATGLDHAAASLPVPVFTVLGLVGRGYADGDALVPAHGAQACAAWADGRAAAVAWTDVPDQSAGRTVSFAFSWNRLEVLARDRLLQNAVEWLLHPPAAAGSVTGQVTAAAGGAPLVGAAVWLEPGGRTATAAADGGFAFSGLPAGTYRLGAAQPGFLTAVRTVAVPAAGAAVAQPLPLAAGVDTLLCGDAAAAAIPDAAPAGVLATVAVPDLGPVGGVRVRVDLDHPWPGDLELELTTPAGTVVPLRRADGRSDAVAAGWYAGDLGPAGDLRALAGEAAAGTWTLRAADLAAGDTGTLLGWCLELRVAAAPEPPADGPPRLLAVLGNRPNPFNPVTVIRYAVPRAGRVVLAVHDLRGRLVRTLVDAPHAAAVHEAAWDGTDAAGRAAASGTYLLRLAGPGGAGAGKVMLLR
ncbi:MAG: C25 family cysteine peptidase [Candidatus Krumholzibacteriia bacterium]